MDNTDGMVIVDRTAAVGADTRGCPSFTTDAQGHYFLITFQHKKNLFLALTCMKNVLK